MHFERWSSATLTCCMTHPPSARVHFLTNLHLPDTKLSSIATPHTLVPGPSVGLRHRRTFSSAGWSWASSRVRSCWNCSREHSLGPLKLLATLSWGIPSAASCAHHPPRVRRPGLRQPGRAQNADGVAQTADARTERCGRDKCGSVRLAHLACGRQEVLQLHADQSLGKVLVQVREQKHHQILHSTHTSWSAFSKLCSSYGSKQSAKLQYAPCLSQQTAYIC